MDLADSEARRNGIHDFIVPIAIDDLPSSEYNIYLHSRNAIPSHPHWSEGLEKLLLKLAKDKVPQNSRSFNDAAVTQWWRRFHNASSGIKRKPEAYLSSWFALNDLPKTLYAHALQEEPGDKPPATNLLPQPAILHANHLFSFAPADDFAEHLEPGTKIASTADLSVSAILDRTIASSIEPGQLNKLLVWLLRDARKRWQQLDLLGKRFLVTGRTPLHVLLLLCSAFFDRPIRFNHQNRLHGVSTDSNALWRRTS